ncbi:MAG: acyltransferase, partial [Planctomycetes bacterium]|nr:acyltransferase [Planctomycetota bacterium]
MAGTTPEARLSVINGLRGYMILAVFCYHLFSQFLAPGKVTLDLGAVALPVSAVLYEAWISVNVFFLLSGFVLYLPYVLERRAMQGAADVRSFYGRRFLRLMPLYFIVVAVSMIFMNVPLAGYPEFYASPSTLRFYFDTFFMATATFTFVPELFAPPCNWILWSLGVEIWFSVIFPLLVFLAQRIGILRLTGAVLLLSLGTRFLGEQVFAGAGPGGHLDPIKDSVIGRLDDFVLGMLLCQVFFNRGPLSHGRAVLAVASGALGLYAACWLWDLVKLHELPRAAAPFINDVVGAGMFLLTYGALSLKKGLLRALFTNAPLQLTGMMCYSLYVWHGNAIVKLFTAQADYALLPLLAR